jgi:hypothetical protein
MPKVIYAQIAIGRHSIAKTNWMFNGYHMVMTVAIPPSPPDIKLLGRSTLLNAYAPISAPKNKVAIIFIIFFITVPQSQILFEFMHNNNYTSPST